MTVELNCVSLYQGHLVEWDRCLALLRSLPLLRGERIQAINPEGKK